MTCKAAVHGWEVQTAFTYGFDNCWRDDGDNLLTFPTKKAADKALRDHLRDCREAYLAGDLVEPYYRQQFKIVRIK